MRPVIEALFTVGVSIIGTVIPARATAQDSSLKLTIINPTALYDPAPNGYSHAVVVQGGTHIVFIAAQGGENQAGVLSPRCSDQVEQAFANLRTVLDAVGAKPDQVAKLTTYVVDYDESMLVVMTRVLEEIFGDALPAQTLVPVPRLALDGMLFEVDAVAVLERREGS